MASSVLVPGCRPSLVCGISVESWILESSSEAIEVVKASIAIVTVCMNREEHLVRTASAVARWPHHQVHIIVDWSSNTPLLRSRLPNDSRIRLVRVSHERVWSPALAYNFGISLVTSDYVMRMDADCWPELCWNLFKTLSPDTAYVGQGGAGRYGQFLMPLEMFDRVGGFNERMVGWGFEDKDLRFRLSFQLGAELVEVDNQLIGVLEHSNERRVSDQGVSTVQQSLAALRASRLRNQLIAAYCPNGRFSEKSIYIKDSQYIWVLQAGKMPVLSSALKKKIDEAMRRCFWGSYLALPDRVVELLPQRILPPQRHHHWRVSWWHHLYALIASPIVLLPAHLLSVFKGFASLCKFGFGRQC